MTETTIAGRRIHPIGIGTWGMGGDRFDDGSLFADYRNDEREIEAIRYAVSRGQDHIDTAQLYGSGHTEEIVGEAIRDLDRSSLYIATKVWRSHSLRHAVPRSVEDSLRKLGTDVVDLLYVHAPWDAIEMADYIGGLNDALDRGLTKAIAVSNFSRSQLEQALTLSKHPIVANQIHYNLLERSSIADGLLDYCREHGVTVVAYRPVERRLLADKTESKIVLDIAKNLGCTPAQLAIAWLIGQKGVVTIPKSSTPHHIDENLKALDIEIPDQDRERLDSLI